LTETRRQLREARLELERLKRESEDTHAVNLSSIYESVGDGLNVAEEAEEARSEEGKKLSGRCKAALVILLITLFLVLISTIAPLKHFLAE